MTQLLKSTEQCQKNTESSVPTTMPASGSHRVSQLGTQAAAGRQAGFVITVEFILFSTLLVLGLYFGIGVVQ